jgi:acyl-CoA thioesterase I
MRSVGAIEVASWLIRHQQRWLAHERSRKGDTLLLTARQLHRIVIQAIAEPYIAQQSTCARGAFRYVATREFKWQQDVFFRGQCRDQLITLKHETDLAAANKRQLVFLQRSNVDTVHNHVAGGGGIEAGQQPQKRALPAARRAHDGDKLARRDCKIDAAKNLDSMGACIDYLRKTASFENHRDSIMIVAMRFSIPLLAVALLAGCSSGEKPAGEQRSAADNISPATGKSDGRKVLVVVGDSISAGYNLDADMSYPALLQVKLDTEKLPWRVVNQGVSGDTTAGGAARIQEALDHKPSAVLLELGGNDGLRGLPLKTTRENLETMITAFRAAGAQVILVGMTLPPNYGPDYIKGFEKMYQELASEHKLPFIPFLLADIITPDMGYFQADGIHPNRDGSRIVADTVMKALRPILK